MIDHEVRAWLMRERPGLVEADDPAECVRKAWAMSGLECSVEDFKAALWRAGFKPDQVRDKFRLALPTRPMEGPNNFHALRNIRSRLDGQR